MNHEPFREWIALRLYGEIDEDERSQLERHLAACEACSRFAAEMESGLGALARGPRASTEPELPADWRQRLREATKETPARIRRLPWWAAAASFAAGVIATAVLVRGPSAPAPSRDPLTTWDQFHRPEPPPVASTGGQLARLSEYLRR